MRENKDKKRIGIKLPNWLGYPIFILVILMPIFVIIGLKQISIETSAKIQNIDEKMVINCKEKYIGIGEELKIEWKNLMAGSILQSSNSEIIEVIDNNTIIGKTEGDAIIYAINGDIKSNEISLKCIIKLEDIVLNKTSIEIEIGEEENIEATVVPENATNRNLTWNSSDEAIATCEERKNNWNKRRRSNYNCCKYRGKYK